MKCNRYLPLLLFIPFLLSAVAGNNRSIGSLSFQANGQWFKADSSHARGYAVKESTQAYINGASKDMVIGIEWKGVKSPGIFSIDTRAGKAEFSINHKSYFPRQAGDFLKITVQKAQQQGAFLLLSGSFEGRLQDQFGNKLTITNGRFETRSL